MKSSTAALVAALISTAPSAFAHEAHQHGSKPAPSASPEPAGKDELKAPGEARVGDKTKCVVSGDIFTVEKDSAKVEHGGKTYFVCCEDCIDQFKANPEKYVGKPSAKP